MSENECALCKLNIQHVCMADELQRAETLNDGPGSGAAPTCGSRCPKHEHTCQRSPGHQKGTCRNVKQKGNESCSWDPQRHAATVILFKSSGKYYTEEKWIIPTRDDAEWQEGFMPGDLVGPFCMQYSPDFRRIAGGAVLVPTQEPWGYPHLLPGGIS